MKNFRIHRVAIPVVVILLVVAAAYWLWSPGARYTDGRHDLGRNGIWLQHGWLGDDSWFERNRRDIKRFRNRESIDALADLLRSKGITYVFPHLCPADRNGHIAQVDPAQTALFLERFAGFQVLPWVGGVFEQSCPIDSSEWRAEFCKSIQALLERFPSLAGIHLNVEPLPSGNRDFLKLLEEIRRILPKGKLLSVAAYPPPTMWHPHSDVHWDRDFYREVASRCDQMVPMMYDTSIKFPKPYIHLMKGWTREVLEWSAPTEVLLGLPTYEDENVGYHHPHVENLGNALRGIHAALAGYSKLPANYAGVAIYSEWVTSPEEWLMFSKEFRRDEAKP